MDFNPLRLTTSGKFLFGTGKFLFGTGLIRIGPDWPGFVTDVGTGEGPYLPEVRSLRTHTPGQDRLPKSKSIGLRGQGVKAHALLPFWAAGPLRVARVRGPEILFRAQPMSAASETAEKSILLNNPEGANSP